VAETADFGCNLDTRLAVFAGLASMGLQKPLQTVT